MRSIVKFSEIFNSPDCILNHAFRHQLLATFLVNIITFSHGIGIGWTSPTLAKIQSPDTPLSFPVSIEEASWIGSLVGLGSLLGNVIYGLCLDRLGRKICIYSIAVPHICLWVLVYYAQSVEFLYVARFFGGITGGSCYVVIPIFISEIADTRIRGTLSAMLMLSLNLGILTGFIISTHLSYHLIPCIIVALPLVYLLAVVFFPETPQHLLRKGKYFAAENSFKFYKNRANTTTQEGLQKCNQEFDELRELIAKGQTGSRLSYKDFITRPALKAFCSAAIIMFGNQFSGSFAFVNYMSHIFAASGSELEPNTCTIIMGVVQLTAGYAALLLVDRCGRKILMLISSGGMAVALVSFGLFTYFAQLQDLSAYSWVPLVLMTCVVFMTNVGIVTLTFVVIVELFPAKIRSAAASICMAALSLMVFCMLKIFPIYMHTFGISVTMWSCAAVCGFCFVYFAIFLPETKGKSMDVD